MTDDTRHALQFLKSIAESTFDSKVRERIEVYLAYYVVGGTWRVGRPLELKEDQRDNA